MKRYSIVHPFVLSFYSQGLYQDVALKWKGPGYLYLLLLLTVCWIPDTIKALVSFANFAATQAPQLIDQVPDITITNGEVFIREPMPYLIRNPENGATIAIIDTTGQTTLENSNAFVLLTKTTILVREQSGGARLRGYDLSQTKDFKLTRERLYGWLQVARKVLPVGFLPFFLLGSYVYRIVQSLVYAAIGLIFVHFLKARLRYVDLIRLSVIAVTPVLILDTLRGLTGKQIPAWGLICLLLALGYLFFGVRASVAPAETSPEFSAKPTA